MQEVENCNSIKGVQKCGETLLKAEADFNLWMDVYPEAEPWRHRLDLQKTCDRFKDRIGLNSKNR